ncbi:MAG TPA: DUF5362 family protein [Vicinamibacterales bacterium]|jgi:hypothetical protein|nr:DUF5362 family protein [Vicinamibacterales bacterium]
MADPARPDGVADILRRTQPWVRLMAIMLFISVAIMVLSGLAAGAFGLLSGEPRMAALLFVYPLCGLVYLFPGIYLTRYASHIGGYLGNPQPAELALALDAQRAFWKFVGILTIIALVLALLGITAALMVPTFLPANL